MYFMTFNNIFSATFDHILPFNDPFIPKYIEWANKLGKAAGVAFLADIITDFKVNHWKWLKQKILWNIANEGDKVLIEWMRNNGFTVDLEQNVLYKKQSK